MSVVGLRDVFVVAPATSFHHQNHHHPGYHQESLLTAAPCLIDDPHESRSKALWQQQQQQQQQNPNPNPNPYLKKPTPMLDSAGILTASAPTSGGGITCQDCGNQAKKDCSHRRCRTCCKSRGFDCSTHVKSTWVPAARRRERQLSGGPPPAAGSSASTSAPKKPRLLSSQNTTTSHTSTSNSTSSSHQDAKFRESLPGQVRAPAVFKCVRVTSMEEDGEDEYAYQAMVKISGHVFKGFLYDHGEVSANIDAIPNMSELHLGGGSGRNEPSSSAMVPTDMSGLLGGTNYGNPIN